MRLETKKYLYDIERAAEQIAGFTAGKQFSDYVREPMLRLAMERAFAIIGEALAQLAKIDAPVAERISEHQRIIAFRNVLIHAYAEVDARLVWDIVQRDLAVLPATSRRPASRGRGEPEMRMASSAGKSPS
jgi:uncharacterized protein with HEPN domain